MIGVGSIVRLTAPGSRESGGEDRVIPAIVMHQWPDGKLQLYCFHFAGSPQLMHAIPPDQVEVVISATAAASPPVDIQALASHDTR